MASNHATLDAAAADRKARLAKLKTLKRKQPASEIEESHSEPTISLPSDESPAPTDDTTSKYLSGRNYDPETRGPKLGFETAPNADAETLENRAVEIALQTRHQDEKEGRDEKPIDLFELQPRKPNWDLKRDMARKLEVLDVRTDNAIARLVRDRLEGQKKKALGERNGPGGVPDEESVGIGGVELVEGVHVREREEEEDVRRERERDEEDGIR